jgi:hypothetical protein
MPDQMHFGGFSKAANGFTSSTEKSDLDLLMKENPSLTKKGYEFSYSTRLVIASFTEQKYGTDATEDICIPPGAEFRIVSLKGMDRTWKNILSFIAVSSVSGGFMAPSKEELAEIKSELNKLYDATKEAKKTYGDNACFLIW